MSISEILTIREEDSPWEVKWKQEIASGDLFFRLLLSELDHCTWENLRTRLHDWLRVFKANLEEGIFTGSVFGELEGLRKYADRLVGLACFVGENRETLDSIFVNGPNLTALMETLNEKEQSEFDEHDIALISAFYWKGIPGEKREIHVATVIDTADANNKKVKRIGPLCTLELRRIKGVGCASPDPTYFPSSDETRFVTGPDFVDAINNAFSMNRISWPTEFKELEGKIAGLEKDQAEGKFIVKSELEGLRSERDFLNTADKNSSDHIDRYSILWRVRLYNEDEEIPPGIDGRSVGLAAYVGIYFALRNKFPDERSIYSAAISGDETTGFTLEKVEGIPEKIQAALEVNRKAKDPNGIPPFDGFAIHEDNFTDIDNDKELKARIEDEGFQIMILNEQGSVVKIFPS